MRVRRPWAGPGCSTAATSGPESAGCALAHQVRQQDGRLLPIQVEDDIATGHCADGVVQLGCPRIEAPTGFNVQTIGADSGITLTNTGDIVSQAGAIDVYTSGDNSDINVETSGNLYSYGSPVIEISTSGMDSDVLLTNRGAITTSDNAGAGIYIDTNQVQSSITVFNYGAIDVYATGINATTYYDDGWLRDNGHDIEPHLGQMRHFFVTGQWRPLADATPR